MIDTDDFDDKTFQLYAGINRSTRYHNRRRMFYERWNAITISLVSVILAVGSVYQFTQPEPIVGFVLAAASAWCVIDAALGTSRKANLHNELATSFIGLEKKFAIGRSLSDDEYQEIVKARLDIEVREPPVLYLLNELAVREFERSVGSEIEKISLNPLRRLAMHFFSFQDFAESKFHAP